MSTQYLYLTTRNYTSENKNFTITSETSPRTCLKYWNGSKSVGFNYLNQMSYYELMAQRRQAELRNEHSTYT
jgi:hypothetical protein